MSPPSHRRCPRMLAALAALLLVGACASPSLTPMPPTEQAIEGARGELRGALEAGAEEIETLAPFRFPARYNPPHGGCLCPAFEIHAFGRWRRVFLRPQDDALDVQLTSYTRDAALQPRRPELVFVGQPQGQSQRCEGSGQRFSVFTLEAIEPSP